MLFRKHPFDADTLNLITRNIINKEYELPAIPTVSDSTADMLNKCLIKNPDNRITIEQLRDHECFSEIKAKHISQLSKEVRKSFFSSTGTNIYKQVQGFAEFDNDMLNLKPNESKLIDDFLSTNKSFSRRRDTQLSNLENINSDLGEKHAAIQSAKTKSNQTNDSSKDEK